MNKLAKRAWFTMILCFALILGLLTITVRYFFKASDWVTFQSSPHVYSNNDTQKHPHKGIPQRLGNILDRKRMVLVFEEGCFVWKQPSVGLSQFNSLT